MKRFLCFLLLPALLLGLMGCKRQVTIDYGTSTLYTKADMDAAIQLIRQEFDTWKGCELHSIRYLSDDSCNDKNLSWMNELAAARGQDATFTQCIFFESSFHSPKKGEDAGAWNPDEEYTGWQWCLARTEGGPWKLMTWGYA